MANAIEMLTADHQTVEALFDRLEQGKLDARQGVLAEIEAEVARHDTRETSVFYPACEERSETLKNLIDRFKVAHEDVTTTFEEINGVEDNQSVEFLNRAITLRDKLRAHAREEEAYLFPAVKLLFSDEELETLGEQMESVA